MATFEVRIQQIFIKPHTDPEVTSIELGNIGSPDGWQVVVQKGLYQSGDLVAYIGENAVVPDDILKHHGFWNNNKDVGMLAGKQGNRVKAIKLRGEFSLGICLKLYQYANDGHFITKTHELSGFPPKDHPCKEGDDVADFLGVTKYEPPVPIAMAGEIYNGGQNIGVNYDIENIKNYPNVFVEGEEVQVTEKLHGTFCQVIVMPGTLDFHHDDHFCKMIEYECAGYIAVGSKGMGAQGLYLKHNEQNKDNLYLRTVRPYFDELIDYITEYSKVPITICGEVFGAGVQSKYNYAQKQPAFRVFDVYIGRRGVGRYLDDQELIDFCGALNLIRVPLLYRGPFSKEVVAELTQHTKSIFDVNQTREGVVIKPTIERRHDNIGRVVLKSINEVYLLKVTGEEIN